MEIEAEHFNSSIVQLTLTTRSALDVSIGGNQEKREDIVRVVDFIGIVMTFVIVPTLLVGLKVVHGIERRLREFEIYSDDSVHDTLHPVFSARQLRFARQRFVTHYKTSRILQHGWQEGQEWLSIKKPAVEMPSDLEKNMREICEAIVEAECSWKEYEFMISGNLAVANRGASARSEPPRVSWRLFGLS